MKTQFSIFLILIACSCEYKNNHKANKTPATQHSSLSNDYEWKKILDSAAWQKSYNFQMFDKDDTLITIHHDGCWISTDAKSWIKTSLSNIIENSAFLDYVKFNNAIYGLGRFKGNIEAFTFSGEINKTTNLKTWNKIAANSNLPNRFFYHPFVFDNKIWIVGGEDNNTQYADIWNSTDGIIWVKVKTNLPFGKRSNSQIVFFKEKLFLLNNDVWSSSDGINWEIESKEILKGEIVFGYTAVVFDNKIWLLGCNRGGKFKSQVFVTSDGKNWEGLEAPWSPRGGIAAVVYKNSIIMTGGKYGGLAENGTTTEFIYSNDVWALEKKQ